MVFNHGRIIQKATRTARWASIPRLISTMSVDTSFTGATRGLPLYELTSPANVVDSTVAAQILSAANHILYQRECSFLADKGYDARSIYNTVRDVYNGEAVIPLKKRGTKGGKNLTVGNPVCEAGLAMHKDGKKNRCCTKYKTIPTDYRLSIDRSCLHFKQLYALRTECGRYNSRFKATGQEHLWARNGKSAANLNTLTHISVLVVTCAAVLTTGIHSCRSRKALRRAA